MSDELQEGRAIANVGVDSLLQWASQLLSKQTEVSNLADGITLIRLSERVTGHNVRVPFVRPQSRNERIENTKSLIAFLEKEVGLSRGMVSSEGLVDGNRTEIMDMLLTLNGWFGSHSSMAGQDVSSQELPKRTLTRQVTEFEEIVPNLSEGTLDKQGTEFAEMTFVPSGAGNLGAGNISESASGTAPEGNDGSDGGGAESDTSTVFGSDQEEEVLEKDNETQTPSHHPDAAQLISGEEKRGQYPDDDVFDLLPDDSAGAGVSEIAKKGSRDDVERSDESGSQPWRPWQASIKSIMLRSLKISKQRSGDGGSAGRGRGSTLVVNKPGMEENEPAALSDRPEEMEHCKGKEKEKVLAHVCILYTRDGKPRRFSFGSNRGVITVGRHSDSDVQITTRDSTVSRRHGIVQAAPNNTFIFQDLSSCGTTISGIPINDTHQLKTGDRLFFGICDELFIFYGVMWESDPSTVSIPTKEGILLKKSSAFHHSWHPRHFRLCDGRLYYFKNQMALLPKGCIDISGILLSESPKPANSFIIVTSYKSYHLACSTADEKFSWLEVLSKGEKMLASVMSEISGPL